MNIRIKNTQRKRRLGTPRIRKQLAILLRSSRLPDAELSVLFAGDRLMRALNRRYRGKDRTTDVLSFSLREGPFTEVQPGFLGDIVISVPVAEKQAAAAGHPLGREIDLLLIHGLLHLMGFDHEQSPREARRMRQEEARLLTRIAR